MNNADKIPTIARLSFRVAPERMAEFEQVYTHTLAPILKAHGLVEIPPQEAVLRPVIEGVFCRLFEVETPEEVLEKKNALDQDPVWQEAVQNLSEWFRAESHEQGTFKLYGMPAVPEKTVPAGGGTGRWHSYDVGNGLGDGEVRAICQDQAGYMWFATRNGGVSRFDGRRFATFGREEGLADRTVLSMIQDQAGYFWFGTLKGVSRYAPWESADRAWRTFTTQDGLAHDVVRAIFQDRDGCLWFGTQGNGVSRFDGEHFTTFNKTNGLAADYVATIYQDRAGYLYFGTGTEYSLFDVNIFHGNGVSRFDGRVWTTLTIADGLAGNDVKAILQDRKGHLWFGTNNGISRFDGQTWHTVTMPGGLLHHGVFAAYEDSEGHLWFGIIQGGAICYAGNTFTHFTTEHGLLHNWVHAIFQDREGHLWFGNSGGVSRYDGQVWRTFTTEDGMVSNDGIAVFQDREGELWFKTHRGLARHRDRAFQIFLGDANLPLSGGTGVFQQRDGTIWICAGNKGALRYNGHVFSVFTTEDGLADGCFAVFEDREKNLWFGTSGGVSRYDGRTFTSYTVDDGLAIGGVWSIFQDQAGDIWVVTFFGISRYDGGRFRTFTLKDGMAHDIIWSGLQDRNGVFWFGTSGGVSRYDGRQFVTITTKDGLVGNIVRSIFEDQNGHLWFGSQGGGVSRYDGRVFQTITPEDGLAGNLVRSIFEDRDGQIWFSTSSGFTRFRQPEPIPPPVFIDAVVADRRYEPVSVLELSSAVGLTAFEFHGMSLKTRPEAMVYRYRLKGFEEDWRTTKTRRVEYENLPMGEYVFEVVAVDRDLVYSEAPATVQLHVVRDARDEQIDELERRVRERTRELQEANTALSSANRELFALNRSLTVEAALERVRAAALAMRKSEDLSDAAGAVYRELRGLGFAIWRCGFLIPDEEKETMAAWLTSAQGDAVHAVGTISATGYPVIRHIFEGWKRGDSQYYVALEGEALANFISYCLRHLTTQLREWTPQSGSAVPDQLHHCDSFFEQGILYTGLTEKPSDEDLQTLKKFADVFSLTYTRFLELQAAEKRAREAQVEAALERVRGKALAMQQPEDIAGVAEMLFAEFHNLGFAPWRSAIRIHDEDSGVRRIWGFQDGELTRAEAPLARFDNNPLSREIEEARRRGSPWFTVKREGPEIRELFERIKNTVGHSEGFVEEALRTCPDPLFLHFIFHSQGSLSILSGRPMTEVELAESKRFADAFDFAYTRFLDLQAAEKRAREAQVEAALERVRVAALGMKSSGDLGQAGTAVFQQLRELGISIWRGGFAIINETSGQPVWEFWGLTGEGVIIRGVEIPIAVHPRFEGIYGAWKRGDEIHQYKVEGDELKGYIDALQRTGYPAQLPENWTSYCACAMFFSHGFLYAISRERLPDSDAAVLGRFRDVFTFAYTRFLDIQKAEAQAKAAARQAAVDRVRAEIATMRTSADLELITPLIWKELTELGVLFVRCGVFILDEETQRARLYLTNPRGVSLASLELPFGCHPYIEAITNHWREQKVYTDRWERQAFEAWMGFLQTQGYAVQPERYQDGAAPPESLVLQCVPFGHGMLYVGSAEALGEGDIGFLKALAEAFSVAYARYLDFQKLEAQNQALAKANAQVREATQRKSAFLASMSHELRTPMNAIMGFTRLVLRREPSLTLRGKENLEKVGQASDHLMGLINDILDLSKIEAGRMDVVAKRFDVKLLIAQCVSTVSPLVKEGVALRCEVAEGVGEACTDEGRVRQMVINLLSNAVKFTEAGEVKIVCEVRSSECGVRSAEKAEASVGSGGGEGGLAPDVLEIIVRDTGVGIPKDKLGSIFEEFVQVGGSESSVQKGTGLGLSITKKFAELLGGNISVESEVGKGSAFTVRIPAVYERGGGQESGVRGQG